MRETLTTMTDNTTISRNTAPGASQKPAARGPCDALGSPARFTPQLYDAGHCGCDLLKTMER
jgi:hypothetical protein